MPPVSQGSRTALVTWTVVTSFLFVTATIFAIYFYVEKSRVQDLHDSRAKTYADIVAEGSIQSPEVAALKELRGKGDYNESQTVLDVAMKRADHEAKTIAGASATSPEAAITAADGAMKNASAKLEKVGLKIAPDSLVSAVNLLSDAVVQRSTEAQTATKRAADAVAELQKTQKDTGDQIQLLTDDLAKARGEAQASADSVTAMTAQKDTQLQESADEVNRRMRQVQEALDKMTVERSELATRVQDKDKEIKSIQQKLSEIRPDVNKPVLRQADGRIVRIPGGGICFIDLGTGDQIIPGMTFEVYDRLEGIPPAGDPTTEVDLPRGKASLEVTRVGPTSSECRVINTTPGHAITEGDLIANLVYDRNTRNKFLVYGSFDLDRDGKATAQDGEIIKRLVTQWGGEVVADINVDTDFVVLGKEPVIPTLNAEERDDPVLKAMFDRAVVESEAYNNISAKARDYRIPILNQNRFLYMVGYFERSNR